MEEALPQLGQQCHFPGLGFGTILEIKEVEQVGLRTKVTTKLKISFDAGVIRWKSLREVELLSLS
jgi:hypothetical protein